MYVNKSLYKNLFIWKCYTFFHRNGELIHNLFSSKNLSRIELNRQSHLDLLEKLVKQVFDNLHELK